MYQKETKKLFQQTNNNFFLGPVTFQDPLSYKDFDSATFDNESNDPESSYGEVDKDQLSYEYSSEQENYLLKNENCGDECCSDIKGVQHSQHENGYEPSPENPLSENNVPTGYYRE